MSGEALNEAWKDLIATALRRNVVVAVGEHRAAVEAAALAAPSTPEPSGLEQRKAGYLDGLYAAREAIEEEAFTQGGAIAQVDELIDAAGAAPSTEPALDDPLMLTSGWTITITEHSDGGYYEPPSQHVSVEWSSPHVKSIRVNEPTIEDALRSIRARLAESR